MADPTPSDPSQPLNDSNSSSRRRALGFDDLIGILVAFGSIGGILWWGLTRGDASFNWIGTSAPKADVSGTVASAPSIFNFGNTQGDVAGSIAGSASSSTTSTTSTTAPTSTAPTAPTTPAKTGGSWFGSAAPIVGGAIAGSAITAGAGTAGAGVPFSTNAVAPNPGSPSAATTSPSAVPSPTLSVPEPTATAGFSDVPDDYWASPFINELAKRGIVQGFEDKNFQPDRPVSRGEYAALIKSIFEDTSQPTIAFKDVPPGVWSAQAIDTAVKANFLKGYPENLFEPEKPISRMEVLLSLTNGFNLKQKGAAPVEVINVYQDGAQIPDWAKPAIAAATQSGVVVNYPMVDVLNPNQPATRAEVSALIHQALVASGKMPSVESAYIVKP